MKNHDLISLLHLRSTEIAFWNVFQSFPFPLCVSFSCDFSHLIFPCFFYIILLSKPVHLHIEMKFLHSG